MAAIGSDGTVCSMTSYFDVCTQDINVFFNELKGVFKKSSKYFITYDVCYFYLKIRVQAGIMMCR